jgi:hypothetical protein
MSLHPLMHRVFPPSEPPDGELSQSFRLVIGGTQLRGSWYLSAIVRLQGFSSCSPAASPRRRSPKTVTSSSMAGKGESGCDLDPALSFKDVHHPGWGGGRAEPELYLPRGFVGQPLPQHSRERALSGPAGGSDFDNAGLVDGGRRQLQRVGLAGSARGAHRRTAQDVARCKGGVRVLGLSCLCPGTTPQHGDWCSAHPGGSEWGSAGGQMAPAVGAEAAAGEVLVADKITATIRARGLRLFVLVLAPRASAWARSRLQRRLP